jgi:class 3 adenylate cyclase
MTRTRRLAAILAADVAGYSRLIGEDEEGTLSRLKALRAEVIDPKITSHKGRIVKTTGDGLLVEFGSVIDALRCAAEMQKALSQGNTASPSDRRSEFRIGIHEGDIVVEDGDIFGDGVNVAARLEGLAESRRHLRVGASRNTPPASSISPSRTRRAGAQFHLRGGRLNAACRAPVEADQGLGYGGRQGLGRTP